MLNCCLWTRWNIYNTDARGRVCYTVGNEYYIIGAQVKQVHGQFCMIKGSCDSLGVDLFPFFLQRVQHFVSIQDQASLFTFLIQLHQHVLHLGREERKRRWRKNKTKWKNRTWRIYKYNVVHAIYSALLVLILHQQHCNSNLYLTGVSCITIIQLNHKLWLWYNA